MRVLRIAIPTPLRRVFDYLPPKGSENRELMPGIRVRVPFGRREVVGILLEVGTNSQLPTHKLKFASIIIDDKPLLPKALFSLVLWAAEYYVHPIGEVLSSSLPKLLRLGGAATLKQQLGWRLTAAGKAVEITKLARAPRQFNALRVLREHPQGVNSHDLKVANVAIPVMRVLVQKAWVEQFTIKSDYQDAQVATLVKPSELILNTEQQSVVAKVSAELSHFQTWLLHGVTGSGKTEIYLQVIAKVLQQGKQALVLVPEIALTPQTVARFQERFTVPIVVFHSRLTDRERLQGWLQAKTGQARIVIGTRSAVFTPLLTPGVIIIDEEHDLSFKQQSGFRYCARDLAVARARLENIPIMLGSATPSLESLYNVKRKRYQLLRLHKRAGKAIKPTFHVVDIRKQQLQHGLSEHLIAMMKNHLSRDGQILLFINRRGFAPVLFCHACGWVAECKRCDAKLTLHFEPHELRCHHCGNRQVVTRECLACNAQQVMPLGFGTERLQQAITTIFPNIKVARIDRDSTMRKGAMQKLLTDIHAGKHQILIGTQMLAKGHHFPKVTLVAVLYADGGLLSADFRGTERFAQLLLQVAGRAGRAEQPGEVLIQTHHPQHPLLQHLLADGYLSFADTVLAERQQAQFPPYHYLALIRVEALNQQQPLAFLQQTRSIADTMHSGDVKILGPVPAPMERLAGRYRAQLLLQASNRRRLQNMLQPLAVRLEQLKQSRQVRWSIDVDPLEMV